MIPVANLQQLQVGDEVVLFYAGKVVPKVVAGSWVDVTAITRHADGRIRKITVYSSTQGKSYSVSMDYLDKARRKEE